MGGDGSRPNWLRVIASGEPHQAIRLFLENIPSGEWGGAFLKSVECCDHPKAYPDAVQITLSFDWSPGTDLSHFSAAMDYLRSVFPHIRGEMRGGGGKAYCNDGNRYVISFDGYATELLQDINACSQRGQSR